jgi:hypothetical protein
MERAEPDTPSPIDYRSPGVGGHRVQRVTEALARDEALGTAAAIGKAAAGVLLTLLAPLFVAFVIKGFRSRTRGDVLPSFGVVFALACLLLVPLLMWYERRTRGEYFSDAVRGESSPLEASSYGEYELGKNRFLGVALTEFALLGPRLLWSVYDWARGTPAVHQPVRLLAAGLVVELLDAGEGVPVKRLARPGRTLAEVQWAVRYLQSRDWVDTSARKDRVWLTTLTRERLVRDLKGA